MISSDTVLSLLALLFAALVLGAASVWRRRASPRQAILMLVLAAVVAANIAIWIMPGRAGKTLASEQRP